MVDERSIDGAKKRKWRKTKDFHSFVAGWDVSRVLGHSPKASQRHQEHVTEWRCVQTAESCPRQLYRYLRAVLWCWANFLHALDIIKTTDAVLPSIPRDALSLLTPECVPHLAATSPSLDPFRFHWTELQLQLRLFHPPYCTPLLVVDSTEWLHYFCITKKKWEQNRRHSQTTMKKCYSFQKSSSDA